MKKSDWQYIVDTLLFMCITGIAVIGLLMGLVIAKGPQSSESTKYFLGLHRHQWGNIHFYLSISFIVLVIIHLILSWSWIKGKARQLFHRGWAAALVLTTAVSLLVLFLFWAFYPKAPGAYEDYGVKAGSRVKAAAFEKSQYAQEEETSPEKGQDYTVITGQMTLLDVEKATGIPAREIADELGLPSNVPLDETLGQLRKKYPFTIQEVRGVVIELLNKKISITPEKKEPEETQIRKEQEMKTKKEVRPKELLHKEQKQRLTRGRMATVPSGILITGRMTLSDLEDITGISARKIAEELGIPSNAPLEEHLGRLRRRYRFTMQEVRDAVAYLMKKKRKEK
jgi:hypothetical protein